MKTFTITEIAKLSGLTKKEIRKHLIAQTLKNTQVSAGYVIVDEDLKLWLDNIPKIESEALDSIFKNADELSLKQGKIYFKDIIDIPRDDDWKTNQLNGIKFADFFCGAGGLSLGLVMAGYEPVLGVEKDESAYESYIKNLGKRFVKLNNFSNLDITVAKNKRDIIKYLF